MKNSYLLLLFLSFLNFKLSYSQCNYAQAISSPNLVTNGDFSLGNTGFTSGYTYATGSLLLESTYTITTNASSIHFAFTGTDHTTGSGNFMVLNGSGTPTFVWNKTVSVQANKYYNFSAWVRNIVTKPAYAGLPLATVELWINGVKISRNLLLDDYPDQWLLLDTTWFSGTATTANLSIKNIGVSLNGNDFAIDDIGFRICCGGGGSKTINSICKGSSVQLNASGVGAFSWNQSIGLSSAAVANPIASPDTTRTYIITFANNGCPVNDTFLVNVINIKANAGLDKSICKRQAIQLDGTGNGSNYSWLPIKNILNNLSATPTVNPDTTTTYILKVTNGVCISRDTVTVFVNPLDVNISNKDTVFCIGDTLYLHGTTNGTSFQWSPIGGLNNGTTLNPYVVPTDDITYFLSTSDAVCNVVDSVILTLNTITVDAGMDTVICKGESVQLFAMANPGCTYKWTPNTDLNFDDMVNPIASPKADLYYTVNVKKGNCKGSDSVHFLVQSLPSVSAGTDKKICFDGFTFLEGTVSNQTSFVWTPALGLSDAKALLPEVRTNSNATYILTALNGKCWNTDTVNVKVNPKVIASFTTNPSVAIAPARIQFMNNSANAYFYLWDFGENGANSTIANPSYLYANTGNYVVWLKAIDSLGCMDTFSQKVILTLDPYLFVPNVFSPGNDGLNDVFAVVYNPVAFAFLEYEIYNRWGQQLFYTKMPGANWWDGTFEGKPCPDGVYFYIVSARALVGKYYDLHGTVTLLR